LHLSGCDENGQYHPTDLADIPFTDQLCFEPHRLLNNAHDFVDGLLERCGEKFSSGAVSDSSKQQIEDKYTLIGLLLAQLVQAKLWPRNLANNVSVKDVHIRLKTFVFECPTPTIGQRDSIRSAPRLLTILIFLAGWATILEVFVATIFATNTANLYADPPLTKLLVYLTTTMKVIVVFLALFVALVCFIDLDPCAHLKSFTLDDPRAMGEHDKIRLACRWGADHRQYVAEEIQKFLGADKQKLVRFKKNFVKRRAEENVEVGVVLRV